MSKGTGGAGTDGEDWWGGLSCPHHWQLGRKSRGQLAWPSCSSRAPPSPPLGPMLVGQRPPSPPAGWQRPAPSTPALSPAPPTGGTAPIYSSISQGGDMPPRCMRLTPNPLAGGHLPPLLSGQLRPTVTRLPGGPDLHQLRLPTQAPPHWLPRAPSAPPHVPPPATATPGSSACFSASNPSQLLLHRCWTVCPRTAGSLSYCQWGVRLVRTPRHWLPRVPMPPGAMAPQLGHGPVVSLFVHGLKTRAMGWGIT